MHLHATPRILAAVAGNWLDNARMQSSGQNHLAIALWMTRAFVLCATGRPGLVVFEVPRSCGTRRNSLSQSLLDLISLADAFEKDKSLSKTKQAS